jgi:hypothetical protein
MFRFSEQDKRELARTQVGSELELRFSDLETKSGNERLSDFTLVNYNKVLDFLWRKKESHEVQKYTNYIYNDIGSSIRLTEDQSGLKAIRKTKINRVFRDELSIFAFRLGEALETRYSEPIEKSRRPNTVRAIERHRIKVSDILFEVSKVDTYPSDQAPYVSYEVEVELPQENIVEYAEKAMSILSKAFLEGYAVPRGSEFVSLERLKQDLIEIDKISGTASKRYENDYSLGFEVNPVNLKRDELATGLVSYCLTNKLDGERRILVNNGTGYLIVLNARGYTKNRPASVLYIPLQEDLPKFILDTEYYQGKFHVFDVASYGDTLNIRTDLSHQKRMDKVKGLEKYNIVVKKFYYSDLNTNILSFFRENQAEKWFHHSDGLIFTQKSAPYLNTKHYKYKFPSKMSIDFKLYGNQDQYEMYVSRRKEITPFKYAGLPSTLISVVNYNEKIVECVLCEGRWVVLRERLDKTFPNSVGTAEDVAKDILNPIYLRELISLSTQEVEDYLSKIQSLEKYFVAEKLAEEGRLISQAYDRSLNNELASFFNLSENERYKKDLDRLIRRYITEKRIDSFIVQTIAGLSTYVYYGNKVEFEILSKLILPTVGVSSFMDSRSELEYSLERDNSIIHVSINSGLAEVKLDLDKDIKEGLFGDNGKITRKGREYEMNYFSITRGDDKISEYSSLMPWHKPDVTTALKYWFPNGVKKIADMTSHVGMDDLHFLEVFPNSTVDAYEISPNAHRALVKNTIGKAIRPIYGDSCYLAYTSWLKDQYDLVFIDAPWGGKDYWKKESVDLYLQAETDEKKLEVRNVVNVAKYLLSRQITGVVILKVPKNFNTDLLENNFIHETRMITDGTKDSYKMILLKPKVGPVLNAGRLLVWSTPYTDSYERIFDGGQEHVVVRCVKDSLKDSVLKTLMEWIYSSTGSAPRFLLDEPALIETARRKKYNLLGIVDNGGIKYNHFSKNPVPPMGQPAQPAQKPVIPPVQPAQRPVIPPAQPAQRPMIPPAQPAQRPMIQPVQKEERKSEETNSLFYMRKYHNIEKRTLISLYCKNRSILDLGAGKGGDLSKYASANINRLILVEPDETKITDKDDGLYERLSKTNLKDGTPLGSLTKIIKAKGEDTANIFSQLDYSRVQVVSSFFSMTFLFESLDILRGFLTTVDSSLQEGGYFIGTMMSGEKAKELLRGRPENTPIKVTETITITKGYSDDSEPSTGQKILIDIEGSATVHQQYEYLSYFSILQEELRNLGFVLEFVYDFQPEQVYDSKNMTQGTKDFSKLNISFVFRKMPKGLPLEINPLSMGESCEFFNLYGEMAPIYRSAVDMDGNCFYHAYLSCVEPKYTEKTEEQRKAAVKDLRKKFSEWITLERYISANPFELYNYIINKIITKELEDYNIQIPGYDSDFARKFRNLPEEVLQKITIQLQEKLIIPLKEKIAKQGEWATQDDINLFMEFIDSNIYIFSATSRTPSYLLLNLYKASRKRSVMILSLAERHYEPLFFGTYKGSELYAKRVLSRFDPHLIYLHQWLIKKNLSTENPRQEPRRSQE